MVENAVTHALPSREGKEVVVRTSEAELALVATILQIRNCLIIFQYRTTSYRIWTLIAC